MSTASEIIAALGCGACAKCNETARRGSGLVHCPAHDDREPSLNVGQINGKLLVKCHATCSQEAVVAALRERGLWESNGHAERRRIVATYPYTDRGGATLYEAIRYEPKDFRVRRPDGAGGWLWNLDGVDRVLYHLPDVRAVAELGWTVFVTEGEKDADALIALGLCATTNIGGAGKWRAEYADDLAGAAVVVIADKDRPGRAHAQQVAASCRSRATSVKVLELPGDEVKDASDWISAGGTRAELERLAAAAPEWTPGDSFLSRPLGMTRETNRNELPFESASDAAQAAPAKVNWIVEGLVARGAVTELAGKVKSAGKTTFALALCRAVIDGRPFAGLATTQTNVVYLTEQSGPSLDEALVRARLWGEPRFSYLRWSRVSSLPWNEVVAGTVAHCTATGAGLFVVDTIGRWGGFEGEDENQSGAGMRVLAPIQLATASADVAALLTRHAKKGVSAEVGEDGRGSSALSGAVDVVLSLRRPAGDAGSTARILHSLSRFDETPETLALRLTPEGYVGAGSIDDFKLSVAKEAFLDAAPRTEADALTVDDLCKVTEIPRATGYRALVELLASGELTRIGAGRRGDPYRHFRPDGDRS